MTSFLDEDVDEREDIEGVEGAIKTRANAQTDYSGHATVRNGRGKFNANSLIFNTNLIFDDNSKFLERVRVLGILYITYELYES